MGRPPRGRGGETRCSRLPSSREQRQAAGPSRDSSLIQLPASATSGTPRERFGLERLVDLSRLLPADPSVTGLTRIAVAAGGSDISLASLARGEPAWIGTDGLVTVSAPLLDLVTGLTSATQEQQSALRDKHGRVPPSENALVRAGVERELILQHTAIRFREAVVRAAGSRPIRLLSPWPAEHRWAVGLSHDLDVVALWPLFTGLRLTELIRHGEWGRAGGVLAAAGAAALADPVTRGVATLLDQEARTGLHSTWFVLCGTPTLATLAAGDLSYRPESPRAAAILNRLRDAGHEIGLHGSFETGRRPAAFGEQRRRLAGLTETATTGVRQHFVRLRPGATHRGMRQAGFGYDASMGFADRNGFRLGVADVVPGWDAERQQELELDLVPFAWMDRTLSKYRGIEDPTAWVSDGLELAARCRAVEGLWAGIWHPNLVPPLGFPGAPEAYAVLLDELGRHRPWIATHQKLVEWRRARRAARVMAIDGQGRVVARAPGAGGVPLRLESAVGQPLEMVEPAP